MVLRLLGLVLVQIGVAVLCAGAAPASERWLAALVGAWLVGVMWLVIDATRAAHFLRWLRAGASSTPNVPGRWRELQERVRRLLDAYAHQTRQSEARLHDVLAALQASPNGVVLLDADMRMEWFNDTAATHFGLVVDRDHAQYIGNLVRHPAFTHYVAQRDYSEALTMPARDANPSKPILLSVHLHPYGEGRLLLLSRDVTALEQAQAMRRDFVANVSHEIRTPLTVLLGFIETMQTLPLQESERLHYLGLMEQQAQRMQALVRDLLTLSRLEDSACPVMEEWIGLDRLTEQCEQDARALSGLVCPQGQTMTFAWPAGWDICAAYSELYSAMTNLVSNAVRYTPAGRTIDIAWEIDPNHGAVFRVRDRGVGIAPEHLARLTQRFYRVDRSRSRDSGGTGLGLAIVKHVAQRHGARLSIESKLGEGSVFALHFDSQRLRRTPASTPCAL